MPPSPRLPLIKLLAEEIGLGQLADLEARAARYRPLPRRLLVRIILAAGTHTELTSKEHEVMYWLCQGKKKPEIAKEMNLGEETIKSHMRHVFKKLGVVNNVQAALVYLDLHQGLHDQGDQSRPDAMK